MPKKILPVGLLCLLLFTMAVVLNAAGIVRFAGQEDKTKYGNSTDKAMSEKDEPREKTEPERLQKTVNVLIAGLDTGEFPRGKKREGIGRTDTLILAHLNPRTRTVNLLSIPRDTLVEIPGRGHDKINHAHPFGGMPLVIETVELFTGVKIDYFIKFDYKCYEEIIKTLGGVEVKVTEELHHKYYDFYPGSTRMEPEQAFVYLRLRNVSGGDLARAERQQRFCIDLVKEMQKPENWVHLPRFYRIINEYGETNIPLWEVLKIAGTFKSAKGADISFNTVPGEDYMKSGIYYWKPDIEKTTALVAKLFEAYEKK